MISPLSFLRAYPVFAATFNPLLDFLVPKRVSVAQVSDEHLFCTIALRPLASPTTFFINFPRERPLCSFLVKSKLTLPFFACFVLHATAHSPAPSFRHLEGADVLDWFII